MTITIEKRSRTLITDSWGTWGSTNDNPPLTNTELVEYRLGSQADVTDPNNSINLSDLTSNVEVIDGEVTGDGYFDNMMETNIIHLKNEYANKRLVGDNYAKAYVGMMQFIWTQSQQFMMNKKAKEIQLDGLEYDKIKKEEDAIIAQSTRFDKIAQVNATQLKTYAEYEYIKQQDAQLVNSVIFNNKVKVFETLGDTYGVAMAGNVKVNTPMWDTFFKLGNDIAGSVIPSSVSITKVT